MVKESFGTWFREARHAAGVEKSAHGLRKWFGTRLRGATVLRASEAACGCAGVL